MYYENVYCPECGCEDVTLYDDGSCECNGCGFVWQEESRRFQKTNPNPYHHHVRHDNQDFNNGMIAGIIIGGAGIICVLIAIIKYFYGLWNYSIFVKEERIAADNNNDQASTWFLIGLVVFIVGGIFVNAYAPSGRGNNRR